jgi:hypothetical protein
VTDGKTTQINDGFKELDKDQEAPLDYPEGFKALANSLKFLPKELREQTLSGFVMAILVN